MEKKKDSKLTIRMSPEKLKKFKLFVLENDCSLQDFGSNALLYCMDKNILHVPEGKG